MTHQLGSRRRSLPAGSRPPACVFHPRLGARQLGAGKCVAHYCRRRQTWGTMLGLPAPTSRLHSILLLQTRAGQEGGGGSVTGCFRNTPTLWLLGAAYPSWQHISISHLTGHCRCLHNTEGPSCERCSPGFYGNPFTGHPDDCKPCPCPGRSPCTQLPSSGEVVCTHCPPGQRGEVGMWGGGCGAAGPPPACFLLCREALRAVR